MNITIKAGSDGMNSNNGNSERTWYLSPFHKGVPYVFPTKKNAVKGFILPAFDPTMSKADQAYPTGIFPYRDLTSGVLDRNTNTPAFTGWFVLFQVSRFVGNNTVTFFSPKSLQRYGASREETFDPCNEAFWHIFQLRKQDPRTPLAKYIKSANRDEEEQNKIPFRAPSEVGVMNMYATDPYDGDKMKNLAVLMSKTGFEQLHRNLSLSTPRNVNPRDKNFEDYLLGDITDPNAALECQFMQVTVGSIPVNMPVFTGNTVENSLANIKVGKISDEVLKGRFDFTNTKEVVRIATGQEIVDFLVNDGLEPAALEVLKEVCNGRFEIGGTETLGTPEAAPAAPVSKPAATPAAPASKPAASAVQVNYWVSVGGKSVKMTEGELKKISAGKPNTNIMDENQQGGWKKVSTVFPAWFAVQAPPPPPPPPEEEPSAPPPPPPEEEPADAPAAIPAGNTEEELKAEQAAIQALLVAGQVTPDQVSRLVEINALLTK